MEQSILTFRILLLASFYAVGSATCTHENRVLQVNETFEDSRQICRCGYGPLAQCQSKCKDLPVVRPSIDCPNPQRRVPAYKFCEENFCDPCPDGRWGVGCSELCGACTLPSCDIATGKCPASYPRCEAGYTGPHCKTACPDGRWGVGCSELCGACTLTSCDIATGKCPAFYPRCEAGYTGPLCKTACETGKHGPDCQLSCLCFDSESCHPVTGRCETRSWTGSRDRRPQGQEDRGSPQGRGQTGRPRQGSGTPKGCRPGTFGKNCLFDCGGCATGPTTCHTETGLCPPNVPRCKDGFVGENCKVCPKGSWGRECAKNCSSHCARGMWECDARDGTCLGGCVEGFTGLTCDTAAATDLGLVIGLAVGGGILVVIVTVLVAVLCIWRRRKQQAPPKRQPDYLTPVNPPGGPVFNLPVTSPTHLHLVTRPIYDRPSVPMPESPEHTYCTTDLHQVEDNTSQTYSKHNPSYISLS